ncbi:MAG: hypothetical protein V1493_03050 [Candidatus Diapherotrites archaeon]
MKKFSFALIALILTMVLSGCTQPESGTPTPTPAITPASSATPTQTPTPASPAGVAITTDRTEYLQGETVKLLLSKEIYNGGETLLYRKASEGWKNVQEYCFCAMTCTESTKCEDYSILCEQESWKCGKQESGTIHEWNQQECIQTNVDCTWADGGNGSWPCSTDINAKAGMYKYKISYWEDENCSSGKQEATEIYSNEFEIKVPALS